MSRYLDNSSFSSSGAIMPNLLLSYFPTLEASQELFVRGSQELRFSSLIFQYCSVRRLQGDGNSCSVRTHMNCESGNPNLEIICTPKVTQHQISSSLRGFAWIRVIDDRLKTNEVTLWWCDRTVETTAYAGFRPPLGSGQAAERSQTCLFQLFCWL